MSYTKTPWEIQDDSNGGYSKAIVSYDDKGKWALAHVNMGMGKEPEANAKLILYAPQIFEALKELTYRCDGPEGVTKDGSNIETMIQHDIISKVEGNSEEE